MRHVCSVQRLRMTGRPSPLRDIKGADATQQHCISTVYPLYQYSLSKVMSIASNPSIHPLPSFERPFGAPLSGFHYNTPSTQPNGKNTMQHQQPVDCLSVNISRSTLISRRIRCAGSVSRVPQMIKCVFLLWLLGNACLVTDFDPLSSIVPTVRLDGRCRCDGNGLGLAIDQTRLVSEIYYYLQSP